MRMRDGHMRSGDGTRIYYQVIGSGRPLFCCNGLGVPRYFWRHLVAHFGNQHQIICWDYRGHGKSAVPPHPHRFSYEQLIDDGRRLLEHLDVREAVGIGHSSGMQVLLGLYAGAPDRFAALASFLGTSGHALSGLYALPAAKVVMDAAYVCAVFYPAWMRALAQVIVQPRLAWYVGGLCGVLHWSETPPDELAVYIQHIRAMDPAFFATVLQAAEAHNADHVLPTIAVPTLCIAAEHDMFVPLSVSATMHAAIPQAEWHVLDGASHAGLFERPDALNRRLGQFLWKHRLTQMPADRRRPSQQSSARD